MESANARRWENMMAWLDSLGVATSDLPVECRRTPASGNGLFSRRSCRPGSLLFSIPAKVMMNMMTLKPYYPPQTVKSLSAMQLISMHLLIWRPEGDDDSKDVLFGPYISTLPREFSSHPLTWIVWSKYLGRPCTGGEDISLQWLPPSISTELQRLYSRFLDDWCKVHSCMMQSPVSLDGMHRLAGIDQTELVMDFLWAWLNVNTRCIFYRLKSSKSDPNNLTMCPVLDFANHSPDKSNMHPSPNNADIWNFAPIPSIGEGLRFFSKDDVTIEENNEILLKYGCHSNKTLFVEYGFVNEIHDAAVGIDGEVDVRDVVEKCFTDPHRSHVVKDVLEKEGYWGDWVIFSTPEYARPSWRLTTALRLYNLMSGKDDIEESDIQIWRDVTLGKRERVSESNERSCRESILHICEVVMNRAQRRLDGLVTCSQVQQSIRTLWMEELLVAQAVKDSMCRGDGF
ncbi:hypothetical protein V8B97DRAFT_1949899 [Scleroderma yunnanense]